MFSVYGHGVQSPDYKLKKNTYPALDSLYFKAFLTHSHVFDTMQI